MTGKTILSIILAFECLTIVFFLGMIFSTRKVKKEAQKNLRVLAESLPIAIQSLFGQMAKAGTIEIRNPGESIFFEMHIRNGVVSLEFNPSKNEVEKLIEKIKREKRGRKP